MTKETGTPPDWARICGEIVVAAYGTKIVGEREGWPLCVYPLEECRDDGSGTLHTFRYDAVPRFHEGQMFGLYIDLYLRGWWVQARKYGDHYVGFVNKDPASRQWRRLRKDSVTVRASRYWEATTLATHKALMADGAE